MATATKRFISRKLAELNEGKATGGANQMKDMDEEMKRSMGDSINSRNEKAENVKTKAKETETIREHLKNIYKSAQTVIEGLGSFRDSLRNLNKELASFREAIEPEDDASALLRDTLGATNKIHDRMVQNCATLADAIGRTLVEPIQLFVKNDVREARYFSHEFLKAQVEYESGLQKLSQVKSKSKADPKKYDSVNQNFILSQQKFDQISDESLAKFKKVAEANIVDNSTRFMSYLASLRDFYVDGHSVFGQMKVHLEKMEGAADKKKRDRSGTIDSLQKPFFADYKKLEVAYEDIVNYISQPDFIVARSLEKVLNTEDYDNFLYDLARIHHKRGTAHWVIRGFIEEDFKKKEVNNKDDKRTTAVLSGNKPAIDFSNLYFQESTKFYMAMVLSDVIKELIKENTVLDFTSQQIPIRVRTENAQRMSGYLDRIINNIVASKDVCPTPIRRIAQGIRILSKEKDPVISVAMFFGSRLYAPAINSPEGYRITDEQISEDARKNLKLLSRFLKSVFGVQDSSQESLNNSDQFQKQSFKKIYDYYDGLSAPSESESDHQRLREQRSATGLSEFEYNSSIQQQDIEQILIMLSQNISKIVDTLNELNAAATALRLQQLINLAL